MAKERLGDVAGRESGEKPESTAQQLAFHGE